MMWVGEENYSSCGLYVRVKRLVFGGCESFKALGESVDGVSVEMALLLSH